jgi:uncharacterized membrane protein
MEFLRYSFLFFFGGICGWVIELLFRRLVHGKWVNPGFLNGPFLPLYGFGVVAFYFLTSLDWQTWITPEWVSYLVEILVIGVVLTIIEYIAGLIFIKGLKVKLWDYSDRPGNIQGIICPLFSAIWTAIGAGYIFVLKDPMQALSDMVLQESALLWTTGIIGFLYGVIVVDFGYSLHIVTKVRSAVADSKLVVSWERMKESFQAHFKERHKHSNWIFALSPRNDDFKTMIDEYVAALKENNKKRQEAWNAKIEAKKAERAAKIERKKAEKAAKMEAKKAREEEKEAGLHAENEEKPKE